jgi:predicted nuclease of predicted toxin-antitoxin system
MKFLIDAQLPRRLAYQFRIAGHQATHTLDLPDGNRTSDAQINLLAEQEQYVVITKDADFVDSFIISRQPPKLLLISTGNITNGELEALLRPQFAAIAREFETHDYLELTRAALVVHE